MRNRTSSLDTAGCFSRPASLAFGACLMLLTNACLVQRELLPQDFAVDSGPLGPASKDSGITDAGVTDTGAPDTGAPDSGVRDAGSRDAQSADASGSAGTFEVTPSAVDFGTVPNAQTVMSQGIRIRNASSFDATIARILFTSGSSANFSVREPLLRDYALAPDDALDLTIDYLPLYGPAAPDTATLYIVNGDASDEDVQVPISGECPDCTRQAPDSGCDDLHPHRIWPSWANISFCRGATTTGPDSVSWTYWGGCPSEVDFQVTAGREVVFNTGGDGCACPGCALWHINYDLSENLGAGFVQQRHVQQPDIQCPGGRDVHDTTLYVPQTTTLKMTALPYNYGAGYYFTVCSQ